MTYTYIEEINEQLLGGHLVKLKSDKYQSMIDLVEKKGRVPSAKARFCTEQLKFLPMRDYLKSIEDEVICYQGIRADESLARATLPFRQWSDDYDCWIERPLFSYTAAQCFHLLKQHGVKPNPLYLKGSKRVGCFPCIMISHGELKRLSETMPEIWDRIAELEAAAGGRSFFPPNYIPKRFHSGRGNGDDTFPTVADVRLYLIREDQGRLFAEDGQCLSIYNLCE